MMIIDDHIWFPFLVFLSRCQLLSGVGKSPETTGGARFGSDRNVKVPVWPLELVHPQPFWSCKHLEPKKGPIWQVEVVAMYFFCQNSASCQKRFLFAVVFEGSENDTHKMKALMTSSDKDSQNWETWITDLMRSTIWFLPTAFSAMDENGTLERLQEIVRAVKAKGPLVQCLTNFVAWAKGRKIQKKRWLRSVANYGLRIEWFRTRVVSFTFCWLMNTSHCIFTP